MALFRAALYGLAVALLLLGCSQLAHAAITPDPNVVYRWSSTGGGWRAMFACVGFANLFQQAGLFTEDNSLFSGIATNSGAAWFSTQLFYSQAFYDQVVLAATPQEIHEFVVQWMESYLKMTQQYNTVDWDVDTELQTNTSDLIPREEEEEEEDPVEVLREVFSLLTNLIGQWAFFVQEMMQAAVVDYGHTSTEDWKTTRANQAGKLPALQTTDFLVQSGLVPTARIRVASDPNNANNATVNNTVTDTAVYLGPFLTDNDIIVEDTLLFSVPLSVAYIANATFVGFQYGTLDTASSTNLLSYQATTSTAFDFADWDTYGMYGDDTLSSPPTLLASDMLVTNDPAFNDNFVATGTMRLPFGGGGVEDGASTVIQVAAISSAAVGDISPLVPSAYAQALSRNRFFIEEEATIPSLTLGTFDAAVNQLYQSRLLDDFAVCGQWPNACGPSDGWFIDGGFTDNPSLVINIAQYHQEENADLTKTMKIVVTNTNSQPINATYNVGQLLVYFATDFNQNIRPGDFIWPPGANLPRRSPQIFAEYKSEDEFLASMEPMQESNMTTALWKATTIENPAYGVRAGQAVEILLININEPIATVIIGTSAIEETTLPLANMAQHIAANQELLVRVQDFFFGDSTTMSDVETPSESDTTDNATAGGGNINEEGSVPEEGGGAEVPASSSFSFSRQSSGFVTVAALVLLSFLTLDSHSFRVAISLI